MAARQTGWAMLASSPVQEAHDLAARRPRRDAAQPGAVPALLRRVPHLPRDRHTIELLDDDDLRALDRRRGRRPHRARGLTPTGPSCAARRRTPTCSSRPRGREPVLRRAVPGIVERRWTGFAERTGRRYRLVDYVGPPDAERVVVLMGSGAGAVGEAVGRPEPPRRAVGVLDVRLYRPFPAAPFVAALPADRARVAVLDRTKEPGAPASRSTSTSSRPAERAARGRPSSR
jgi:pyruvate-ferredoxin/flavodoxin oxidoreductase